MKMPRLMKRPPLKTSGRKKKRLKYIAVMPSFITLLNGAFGFMAIVFASRNQELQWGFFFTRSNNMSSLVLAGYMITFAMIADMLDGRVARLTRTTSSFGGQLDSLTDAISFGVAPVFLMVKLMESHLDQMQFEKLWISMLAWRAVFFSAILYAMCAVVRLARFNVENEEDESAHMNFAGLPTPAAAGVVVSLVILHQHFLSMEGTGIYAVANTIVIITAASLPVITLLVGILMVSRIRYPHLPNQLLRGKKTLTALLLLFASGFLVVWNIQLAMVIGFCGFALFGIIRWIMVSLRKLIPSRQYKSPSP